jgi:DME family drug/metabolite transporter
MAMAAMQLFFFSAMKITGVAVGTMVAVGAVPVMSGLAGRIVLKENLDHRWFCSAALAVAGIVLLSWKSEGIQVRPLGVLLALLASTAGTMFNLLLKHLRRGHGSLESMGMILFVGGLLAFPLFFFRETAWLSTPRGIAVALHLGFFTGAAAYALFARGIRVTPLSQVGILMLTEPLTAFFLGVFLLGEQLTSLMLVGAVSLLLSVLLLSLPRRKAA